MPFKYACFISHACPDNRIVRRFTSDLRTALQEEIQMLVRDYDVYISGEEMRAGMMVSDILARALCESICMVMVYTPSYFSVSHPYCAREYRGMELLEQQRLAALSADDRGHGLIIPVVLRGEKLLPSKIRNERHFYNFGGFTLCDPEIAEHKEYARMVKKIAEYVGERVMAFERIRDTGDPTDCCNTWKLPSDKEAVSWIRQELAPASGQQDFPLR